MRIDLACTGRTCAGHLPRQREGTSTLATPPLTAFSPCTLSERGYSVEAAVTLVYELALPVHTLIDANQSAVTPSIERIKVVEFIEHWSRLSPAARRTVEAEAQALPEAERGQAFYNMAFFLAPRPKESP